jgi:hypothetical protein
METSENAVASIEATANSAPVFQIEPGSEIEPSSGVESGPRNEMSRIREENATQLAAIRDLMISMTARGAWLTLSEIAEQTQFGEASISAQLRHLRKPRHGRYLVEKRPRRQSPYSAADAVTVHACCVWEYRVLTPTLLE